ncbi:MAG: aminopeptidase P family protein [Lachnospiraceae bacterium]|nr:aminopeptidase P family protein [Lachnospiraceae bacterium]
MRNIYKERIERLRSLMRRDGIDYYVVLTSDPHMSEYLCDHYKFREYLSGFTGSAGTLLVGLTEALLWTDGRYYIQAESELSGSEIKLMRMQDEGVPTICEYLRDRADEDIVIGFDGEVTSVSFYEEIFDVTANIDNFRINVNYADEVWEDRPARAAEKMMILPGNVSGKSTAEKLKEIRTFLSDSSLDQCVITDLSDVMWVFNIRGNDIEYNPVAYSYAVISGKDAMLFIDEACMSKELKLESEKNGYRLLPYDSIYDYAFDTQNCVAPLDITCDFSSLNHRLYHILNEYNYVADIPSHEYIKKQIKNETEIRLSKEFHKDDAAAVINWIYDIKKRVKTEKITEYEAAMLVDSYRADSKGFVEPSFATICAYRENAAIVHYEPDKENSKTLEDKGFVLLDSGGQYRGATTDITRTVALGALTDEEKISYTAVLKGHLRLMSLVFLKGVSGENLDIAARSPLWELCLNYKHGTGHGVGSFLSVHEGPQSFNYHIKEEGAQPPLESGMITSDEPGIYIEGEYGIRIENLLLCVEKKTNEWGTFLAFEPLSLVPFEREAIVTDMINQDEKKMLNEYHKLVYESLKDRFEGEKLEWLTAQTAPL